MSTRITSPLIVPFVDGENVRGEPLDTPALPERPSLLMHVGEAPLGEALHRPLARALEVRRPRHAWAIHVSHPPDVIHDLRFRQRFLLDARDGAEIDGRLGLDREDAAEKNRCKYRGVLHMFLVCELARLKPGPTIDWPRHYCCCAVVVTAGARLYLSNQ